MNLALLAPLGLAALAALALPLLIHLVRRLQLVDTEFAALRWISSRAQPRRRLRFERPWLLLIRLVLLALLALLLARLVSLAPSADANGQWIAVAPGADLGAARTRIGSGGEWHWLAPGFPRIDANAAPSATPTASLLRELDARMPAGSVLRVVVPEILGGLDGERAHLAHALDWIVVPGQSPSAPGAAREPVVLHVRYADDETSALAYLRAVVAAWNMREPNRYTLDAQPMTATAPDDARWLVRLAPDFPSSLTSWVERGGVALVAHRAAKDAAPLWQASDGSVLASEQSLGAGRVIALPNALAPSDLPLLLDADFPNRLLAAFRGEPPATDRAFAAAAEPDRIGADVAATPALAGNNAVALDAWLAIAIAVLFALERIVATIRPREAEA
jgi:hypothetical protein